MKTVRVEAEDMEFIQRPGYGMCPKVATAEGCPWAVIFYNWNKQLSLAGQALRTKIPVTGLYSVAVNAIVGYGYDFPIDTGIDILVNTKKVGHLIIKPPSNFWREYLFPAWLKEGEPLTIAFMRSGNWNSDVEKFAAGTFIDYVAFKPFTFINGIFTLLPIIAGVSLVRLKK